MPRTSITVTESDRSGVAQPAVQVGDNANGMSLAWNDGRVLLELTSNSGVTVFTFPIPGLVDGQTVPAKSISVTAGTPKVAGPFPPAVYNQADGTLQVNIDTANGRLRAYHF